jgi:N-acetylglucosamine malate deacetylase 1
MIKDILHFVERQLWSRRAYKFVQNRWTGLADMDALADVLSTMRTSRDLKPIELEFPAAKNIVVLAPHPDDEVIGPGGTLIGGIERGCRVTVIYLTSGSSKSTRAEIRENEALEAAALMGFETIFLGLSALEEHDLKSAAAILHQHLVDLSPDIIFTPFLSDDHIEHRKTGEILVRATEMGNGIRNPEIWAYQVYGAVISNVIVDITTTAEAKASAIRLYESQMKRRDWAHFALGLNAFNSRFLPGGATRYAEMYFVLPLSDYCGFCAPYFSKRE